MFTAIKSLSRTALTETPLHNEQSLCRGEDNRYHKKYAVKNEKIVDEMLLILYNIKDRS